MTWSKDDRQRFADRDILKASSVPPADKPAPEADEWDDLTWDFLDEEPLEPMSCSLENPETCESCQ